MINSYDTTYGKLLNISKVIKALTPYINISELDSLEYDYPSSGETRAVFITGYNDDEREMPTWEHPVVITTLKGDKVIVSDLRKYVKSSDVLVPRLADIYRDANSANFIILRTLLTRDFMDGVTGKHRDVFKPSATAKASWISGMVSNIVSLTPMEAFDIEIVSSVYANTLYYNQEHVLGNRDTITARVIGSKHTFKLNKKVVKERCDDYVITDAAGVNELLLNLTRVLPADKAQFVTLDSLISVMGNVWYGPGSSESPIIALENMPTWLTLLYSVISNKNHAKSRLGTLLNRNNRVIDAKVIDKHFTLYIKENIVD